MIGRNPVFIVVDELHDANAQTYQRLHIGSNSAGDYNQKDVDEFCEVMERLRRCAVPEVMRNVHKACQQKHGPRDRWGKCK